MKITFLTLFPDFYDNFKETSIIKKAIKKNIVEIETVNIRDFCSDKNKRVDDKIVGGGAGLVFKCEPVLKSIESVKNNNSRVIFLSSRGTPYSQKKARELAGKGNDLVLLCGHYEGIDERILDYVDEEISIGDYILTGGEIPSMVVADSIIRLLEGAIREESHLDESYENGLLEYPQYTLPRVYNSKEIPEILFSGNHETIRKWQLKESLRITKERRPDLLEKRNFTEEEKELLKEIKENIVGKWEFDAILKSKKFNIVDVKLEDMEFKEVIKENKFLYNRPIEKNDVVCFINTLNDEFVYRKVIDVDIAENNAFLILEKLPN